MKNLIIMITFILATLGACGQVKVNGKAPYTISQQMLLKSASEQNLYVKNHYKGIGFGFTGIGLISLGLAIPDDKLVNIVDADVLYSIGGALALIGAYFSIKAPLHLKRSAAYVEASVTGVRISF
tara:strand:+ start:432 stop:806 length:375 start_codon:yes stop_codon:yes gene_type:complete